ncbi:hypothetical protein ABZ801_01295 [Actinomadura sp. NPDC047616]|uniref:hypothetical protein n=1 Tax=Actinomadura sp. NPDC047616 TaxID=3155914 RepID=UPI0033FB732C
MNDLQVLQCGDVTHPEVQRDCKLMPRTCGKDRRVLPEWALREWEASLERREEALRARERAVEEKTRDLNARECVVIEAETQMVDLVRMVAAVAFRRGAEEAHDQGVSRDAIGAALALPAGLPPVPVDVRACGYTATARVIPGKDVSPAKVLESLVNAIDRIEQPSE